MDEPIQKTRTLAVDLRTRRLGYAVFEGAAPPQLLDWGNRIYRVQSTAHAAFLARKRLRYLLTHFAPAVVVVKSIRHKPQRTRQRLAPIFQAIQEEVGARWVQFEVLEPQAVRRAFVPSGRIDKHAMATMVATHFPELLPLMPPKRKIHKNEHDRMTSFDAIALGHAYLIRSHAPIPDAAVES